MLQGFINFILGKKNEKLELSNDKNLYEREEFENIINNAKYGEESFDDDSINSDDKIAQDEEIKIVDTKIETDKKCPCCDGVMAFDPETGGLVCPYCGYKAEIERESNKENGERAEELDFDEAENVENCVWGAEKKTVVCRSCGAETIYDDLEISGVCPYCGSNQVMEAKEIDTIAPGGVCVFRITEKEAIDNFKIWIKRRIFCPGKAKKNAKPGKIKGIYLPYWTFDTDTKSQYTGKYGIDKSYTDDEGNKSTKTDWYRTAGYYEEFINDELVIATNRHDESILKGVEPFDTEDNVLYKPEYVAGFGAERYSVGLKEAFNKAKEYIKHHLVNKIQSKIKNDNNADKASVTEIETVFSNVKYKYLLLPIWISSFKYNDKIYQFMINGQTGKVSGKTPISFIRVAIAVILASIAIGLILYLYKS